MPTRTSTTRTAREAAADESTDALELLGSDHDRVQRLFEGYAELVAAEADDAEKQQVVEEICLLLAVHAAIEEEFFYPAARRALDDDLVDEAQIEHASVRELIDELSAMNPLDELYDDRVRLLAESVGHHVEQEESELFPQLREAGLDLETLGEQMAARREDLLAELADRAGDSPDED